MIGNNYTKLHHWWNQKVSKYGRGDLKHEVRKMLGEMEVKVGAVVLSERGKWCSKNDETMKLLGLRSSLRDILVVRNMEASIRILEDVYANHKVNIGGSIISVDTRQCHMMSLLGVLHQHVE